MKKKIGLLVAVIAAAMSLAFGACGSKEKITLEGSYHTQTVTEGSSANRGCDLFVILNADNSIYTIALDDDSPYQCADMQVLWSIKSSNFFNNLASLGVDGINKLKVNVGENGLPTSIEGINAEWLGFMNDTACGMVVLALQDAFKKL